MSRLSSFFVYPSFTPRPGNDTDVCQSHLRSTWISSRWPLVPGPLNALSLRLAFLSISPSFQLLSPCSASSHLCLLECFTSLEALLKCCLLLEVFLVGKVRKHLLISCSKHVLSVLKAGNSHWMPCLSSLGAYCVGVHGLSVCLLPPLSHELPYGKDIVRPFCY